MTPIFRLPGAVRTRSPLVEHDGLVSAVAIANNRTAPMYQQTKEALANIDQRLAKVGIDKSRIMTAQVFIADMAQKNDMNRAWDEWVDQNNPPMRACLGVVLEGTDLVEIIVSAAK
ncbi:MAG: RidA family protein [Alphaproteobacteria bacterium]|nr:RidA family protein [Alphaproteobacteria bacterium]